MTENHQQNTSISSSVSDDSDGILSAGFHTNSLSQFGSSDFDMYDDMLIEHSKKMSEDRTSYLETRLVEYNQQVESLLEKGAKIESDLSKERNLRCRLGRTLYLTMTTARNQVEKYRRDAKNARQEQILPVNCPMCGCDLGANRNSEKIFPKYTRVLKGRNIVEVHFDDYEQIKLWIQATGLSQNSDGLPTLPDVLTAKHFPSIIRPSLNSSGSRLMKTSHSSDENICSLRKSKHETYCSLPQLSTKRKVKTSTIEHSKNKFTAHSFSHSSPSTFIHSNIRKTNNPDTIKSRVMTKMKPTFTATSCEKTEKRPSKVDRVQIWNKSLCKHSY